MTNEQLIRQYYDGDEAALEKLYHKNIGLIRGIAKEAAAEFNCLTADSHHPNQFSAYTKTILDDLCGEGALEFLTRIQSREYDESRAVLTTYLYPHLKGRMTRWLEQNIGCMALSKDEMAAVRQVQRLYHVAWKDTGEIAEELGIPDVGSGSLDDFKGLRLVSAGMFATTPISSVCMILSRRVMTAIPTSG